MVKQMKAQNDDDAKFADSLNQDSKDTDLSKKFKKINLEQEKQFMRLNDILDRSREQELYHSVQKSSLNEISGRIKKMIMMRKEKMYLLK